MQGNCPHCGRQAKLPENASGKWVRCGCGKKFAVEADPWQSLDQQTADYEPMPFRRKGRGKLVSLIVILGIGVGGWFLWRSFQQGQIGGGQVSIIRAAIQEDLGEPSSLEIVKVFPAVKDFESGGEMVRVKYRCKAPIGGMVANDIAVIIVKGAVKAKYSYSSWERVETKRLAEEKQNKAETDAANEFMRKYGNQTYKRPTVGQD